MSNSLATVQPVSRRAGTRSGWEPRGSSRSRGRVNGRVAGREVVSISCSPVAGGGSGRPAGRLFGVVAGFAETLAVAAVVAPRRRRFGVVACRTGASHQGVRQIRSRSRMNRAELPGTAVPGSPSRPAGRWSGRCRGAEARPRSSRCRPRDELAGQLGGDGSVTVEVGWLVAGAEQGVVGHHQVERDPCPRLGCACPETRSTRVSAMTCPGPSDPRWLGRRRRPGSGRRTPPRRP